MRIPPSSWTLAAVAALAAGSLAGSLRPGRQDAEDRYGARVYRGAADRPLELSPSPVTRAELERLQQVLLFTDDDVAALRASRALLEPHVEEILDTWYGFVGATPQLLHAFETPGGEPNGAYLEAVRERFRRWILDTADARHDERWLAYQHEIGRRHHRTGKNRADGVEASEHIPFRYLVALAYPITHTLRPFLERGDATPEEVERMHAAWVKSVLLQVILWSHPYVREGDF